jgi:hypothetical protein
MATTVRALRKSCPICGETLSSSGAYEIHVARAHGAAAFGPQPGPDQGHQPSPRPAADLAPARARPPASPLPLVAFALAVLLAVAGVAVVVDRSGHSSAPVVATGTPLPPSSPESDKALAERIVLKAGDLPVGWKAEADDTGDGSAIGKEIGDCANGIDPTKGQSVQTVDSPHFVQPPFSQLQATVDVDSTLALAKADFGSLDAVMTCIHDGFAKAAASGGFGNLPRGVTAKVGPVEPLPTFPYGDESAARRVTITVQGPGGSVPLSLDVRLVRRQRIVAALMTFTNGSTLTADQEQDLVGKMASRMP